MDYILPGNSLKIWLVGALLDGPVPDRNSNVVEASTSDFSEILFGLWNGGQISTPHT
jgi:hypothetical protein